MAKSITGPGLLSAAKGPPTGMPGIVPAISRSLRVLIEPVWLNPLGPVSV
jgi:hypothetical protein